MIDAPSRPNLGSMVESSERCLLTRGGYFMPESLTASRTIETPIGALCLVASEQGFREVAFFDEDRKVANETGTSPRLLAVLDETERQLAEYLDGGRQEFDLVLDLQGTDFQRRIPFGATTSYGA